MPRGSNRSDEASLQRRLWTPEELRASGLLLGWWDPADFSSLSGVSGSLSQMRDKSGFDHHANSHSAIRPPFATNKFNGYLPGYSGDGATYLSQFDSTPSGSGAISYSATPGFAIMAVAEQNGTASIRSIIGGTTGAPVLRWSNTQRISIVRSHIAELLITSTVVPTGYHLVGFDAKTGLTRAWLNGTSEQNTTDPAFTSTFARIMDDNGTARFNGVCGEIVCSNVLDNGRRQRLEGYLAWKWQLVSNLPASHPYKNSPPLIGA